MRKSLILLMAFLPAISQAGDGDWRTVFDQTSADSRVVSVVKQPDEKPFPFGPIVFFGHRLSTGIKDQELTRLQAAYLTGGFVAIPSPSHPGRKVDKEWGLQPGVITSQLMYNGNVEGYKNLEAEIGDNAATANIKGIAQTVFGSALMAVGAIFHNEWLGSLGMASASNSAEFGSLVVDDPSWFKTLGDVPPNAKNIVVVRTWIDRRDENDDFKRVILYTTIFGNRDELETEQIAKQATTAAMPLLIARPLSEKQREWLDRSGWANLKVR